MAVPWPPLWTALTVYKLTNVIAILVFCLKKDLQTYHGLTIELTTSDMVGVVWANLPFTLTAGHLQISSLYWIGQYKGKQVLMALRLYWIDQYEGAKKLECFKFDLVDPIVIGAKYVFGEDKPVASFQLYNCGACIDGEGTNIQ